MDLDLLRGSMSAELHLASVEPWDDGRTSQPGYQTPPSPPLPLHSPRPNRVRPKAASPKVISSILTSLDALNSRTSNDQFSDSASRRSRAESSSKSHASSASIQRISASNPSFGFEYGRSLDLDDEDGLSDAALPPSIPTSRPPSGLSNYPTKRLSFSKSNPRAFFRTRTSSPRSFLSGASPERPSSARHKLSSESWVRNKNEHVDRDDRSPITRGRTSQRGLGRATSQEMLRQAQLGPSPKRFMDIQSASLAEQIIARSPPTKYTPKGRLYLTDEATISEALAPEASSTSPSPLRPSPVLEPTLGSDSKAPSEEHLGVKETASAKEFSPILDSIPTRTSSLRLSSNSPASGKRKSKKSNRNAMVSAKPPKTRSKKASPISDSSWADLGEDDETVRRIKQLREQRMNRLQGSTTHSLGDDEDTSQNPLPVYELLAPLPEEIRNGRPSTSRSATQLPSTRQLSSPENGRSTLSNNDEGHLNDISTPTTTTANGENAANTLDVQRPLSVQGRPTTSRSDISNVQPVSLDYSYVDAVDAFSDAQSRQTFEKQRPVQDASDRRPTYRSKASGLELDPTALKAFSPQRLSKKAKKSPQSRGARPHPNLPVDQKDRRKSVSDARHTKAGQHGEQHARRDSIENAVTEFLVAPRLTQKIKHPTTGRTIAFSEVGDPEGAAVFVCVGMGLTRYVTAFYDELAATLRLRLITIDRPGVGASEPVPLADKSGPLSWPEDVLAVCQHLGIIKFSILAHSAGAIYALATALILPHLVKGKVHLLAPWVPPSQLEAISHPAASLPPANPLPRSQRFLRVLPTPFLKAANSSFMTANSASLKPASKRTIKSNAGKTTPRRDYEAPAETPMSPDRPEYRRRESMMLMDRFMPTTYPLDNFPIPIKDLHPDDDATHETSLHLSATATPTDPSFAYATSGLNAAEHAEKERQTEFASRLTERTWVLATRDSNPATDLVVCLERNRDVGFRYTDVGREVVITHGSEDKRVPVANVRWLGEQMNRRAMGANFGAEARGSEESYLDASQKGGCEVRVLEGEGHGLMASPIIMGDVLTEIAGYSRLG